ncbi:MAG TPA: TetR/AcrR family transcriptional regulator [Ilumatobacteraceae bacterium]
MNATRHRIVAATTELFRQRGYNGTSLHQITTAADATTGSLYHFFPGGKDQLTAEVIATSGEAYRQLFDLIADAAVDAGSAITDVFEGAAIVLEETEFIDPCPIGTVAREVASTNDELRQITDAVFNSWISTAARRFESAGIEPTEAHELATTAVAAIEGGFVLSRAARDAGPLRATGRTMRALVDARLAAAVATSH